SLLAGVAAVSHSAYALDAKLDPTAGDEDPFPLACVDFSGSWKSDDGDKYAIAQKHCSEIRITASATGNDYRETLTIVP
ncbi:hypothetical protein ABTF55_21875, partial [Acinetobacter baumannii]